METFVFTRGESDFGSSILTSFCENKVIYSRQFTLENPTLNCSREILNRWTRYILYTKRCTLNSYRSSADLLRRLKNLLTRSSEYITISLIEFSLLTCNTKHICFNGITINKVLKRTVSILLSKKLKQKHIKWDSTGIGEVSLLIYFLFIRNNSRIPQQFYKGKSHVSFT